MADSRVLTEQACAQHWRLAKRAADEGERPTHPLASIGALAAYAAAGVALLFLAVLALMR